MCKNSVSNFQLEIVFLGDYLHFYGVSQA